MLLMSEKLKMLLCKHCRNFLSSVTWGSGIKRFLQVMESHSPKKRDSCRIPESATQRLLLKVAVQNSWLNGIGYRDRNKDDSASIPGNEIL
jgi:hypothetical protein